MSSRDLRSSISAAAHAARDAAYELDSALDELEDAEDIDPQTVPFLDISGKEYVQVDASEGALALEDATRIILAFYNICRDLGHTTPVMTDAREFLRQYAPQEVW